MNKSDNKYRHFLHAFVQRVKTFVVSKDALMFCLFVLLASGIWFVHALQKQYRTNNDQSHEETLVENKPAYAEKHFENIPVHPRGVPKNSEMRLFPPEVSITATVDVEHYSTVTPSDFSAVCTFTEQSCDRLPVEVSCSSPYVISFTVKPQTAEYVIQMKQTSKQAIQ